MRGSVVIESYEFEQINLFETRRAGFLGVWCRGSVPNLTNPVTSRRAQLQEDTKFRVLHMLEANPDLTQREIAQKLGVSTSGLNYCLRALIEKGLVKVQNFNQSKNKFGYVYLLTPQGAAVKALLTARFLKRKMAEYEVLRSEIDALSAENLSVLSEAQSGQVDKS